MNPHKLSIGWVPAMVFSAMLTIGSVANQAADEDFNALVKRLQTEKPKFAKRHQDLLAERYDLSDRPAQGVTMSRGKPVQEGVRVCGRSCHRA